MITVQTRRDLTPQGYIRRMFAETANGRLTVEYENPDINFEIEERTFFLNWSEGDAEDAIIRYNLLTASLSRIGRLHDKLNDEESRKELLSEADLAAWETYVRPYEPMKVNWDELYPLPPCEPDELILMIQDIHERGQYGDLIDEERLLWKKYCMWREEESRKRIPFNRRSSADLIARASRYERLISLGAPEVVVTEEGRWLAEEIVLYYFGKEEPIVWD